MKVKYRTILKIILTLSLLLLLLIKIPIGDVVSVLLDANRLLLLISISFVPVAYIIKAVKWNILLKHVRIKMNFFTILKVILIGTFYGMLTPGRVGEIAKSHYLEHKKSITIPTILWDRLIDIFTLILLSFFSFLFLFSNNKILIELLLSLICLFVIIIFFINNPKIIAFFVKLVKLPEESKDGYLDTMRMMLNSKKVLFKVFIWSFCYYLIISILALIALKALDPSINMLLFFAVPLLILVGNLPITISGLGLRELVSVLCFTALGEEASIGFSFSILVFIITIAIPGIIGAFITLIPKLPFSKI